MVDKNNLSIIEIDFYDARVKSEILDLLNRTFNSTLFTETWWDWKYLSSPFGVALGWCVVNKETARIVAVRILWKWQFVKEEDLVPAYQMIDTATDSYFRGLGLFFKLTKQALLHIDGAVVFNFPNANSAPLNLKMGWSELDNRPWLLSFSLPYGLGRRNSSQDGLFTEQVANTMVITTKNSAIMHTHWTSQSMAWRFAKHPTQKYYYYCEGDSMIIYRIEQRKCFRFATLMFLQVADEKMFKRFSSHLFFKGILGSRYNGYNDVQYNRLSKQLFSLKIKSLFRYYSRNTDCAISITTADTDFL